MESNKTPPPLDKELTCAELAVAIGPRRAGRPTCPDTIRRWMNDGICGVFLEEVAPNIGYGKKTTWGAYLRFVQQVRETKAGLRQERRETIKKAVCKVLGGTSRDRRRAEEAKALLEASGLR